MILENSPGIRHRSQNVSIIKTDTQKPTWPPAAAKKSEYQFIEERTNDYEVQILRYEINQHKQRLLLHRVRFILH